jgi:hypothetical protein
MEGASVMVKVRRVKESVERGGGRRGVEEQKKKRSGWSRTYTALDELVSKFVMKEGRSGRGERKCCFNSVREAGGVCWRKCAWKKERSDEKGSDATGSFSGKHLRSFLQDPSRLPLLRERR